jgi:hypothetical protein
MRDILALLKPIQNSVSKTTVRQLSHIILAMLSMTGRITMLGLSRWGEKGGSYRTIQRFFSTTIPWSDIFWSFFKERLFDPQDCFLLAGDESIVTKAGKQTYGLDCFFSGLMKRAVCNCSRRNFYPLSMS